MLFKNRKYLGYDFSLGFVCPTFRRINFIIVISSSSFFFLEEEEEFVAKK